MRRLQPRSLLSVRCGRRRSEGGADGLKAAINQVFVKLMSVGDDPRAIYWLNRGVNVIKVMLLQTEFVDEGLL